MRRPRGVLGDAGGFSLLESACDALLSHTYVKSLAVMGYKMGPVVIVSFSAILINQQTKTLINEQTKRRGQWALKAGLYASLNLTVEGSLLDHSSTVRFCWGHLDHACW